ncbi:MAG: aminoglycoside phosphotransferase family protein [Dinoroseobacter sp.]|nr:aminoglycoside phosphotransferase family protein [Dinoroseobacter sp.]
MLIEQNEKDLLGQVVQFLQLIGGGTDASQISRLTGGRTSSVFLAKPPDRLVSVVVKISQIGEHTPLFDNRPLDEWRILTELSPSGLAPMPVGRLSLANGQHLLGYQFFQGSMGARTPNALATLLKKIHTHDVRFALPSRPTAPENLMAQADSLGASGLPSQIAKLRPSVSQAPPLTELTLVHRDPIASNIVSDACDVPLLIDWQCPARGDPLEDIAHATSPAMAHVYGSPRPFSSYEVLIHYGSNKLMERALHLLPIYRWRMVCYCAWQVIRGNQIYQKGMEMEAEALERLNSH